MEHEGEMMTGEDDKVEEAITDGEDEVQLDSPCSSNTQTVMSKTRKVQYVTT